MLFLLDRGVKTVKWNGIPLHEADSAIVKEEQNGDFTLNVRYPITDSGIYQLIKEDMLIKAPAPVLGPQLFRIKKPIENDDHLEIQAYHITDDVMKRSVKPLKVVNLGCAMALSQMVQNAKADIQDFSFTSDIWDKRTFNTTEDDTLYSILLDGKHSIVGTWEGELVRDNFALTVKKNRGTNRGVIITTHKNLKSYQRTKDSQNVVTRIYAKSTFKAEGAEEETTLKVTVDSPLSNSYPYVNEKEYENNNAKTIDELKQWAEAKFKNEGIDKSSDAIKIEAYELDGQVVHMGDIVNIKSRKHNVDLYKKAVAYEFDCLANNGKGAYISITFDDKPGVGGSRVSNGISSVANEILEIGNSAQEIAIERALRNADKAFEAEFEKQKSLINDGIEQAKAKAEQVKSEISQSIEQKLQQTKSEVVEKVKQDFNQGLANAKAEIGKVKQNLTNLQSSAEANIKQVKSDLAGIRTQQTTYEQSNEQNLARITGQLADKASKTEVKQTAEGIREEISQISIGGTNLVRNGAINLGNDSYWGGTTGKWAIHRTHGFYKNGKEPMFVIDTSEPNIAYIQNMVFNKLEKNTTYTLSFVGFMSWNVSNFRVLVGLLSDTDHNWKEALHVYNKRLSATGTQRVVVQFNSGNYDGFSIRFDNMGSSNGQSASVWISEVKVEKGTIATDWSPAPEDVEEQITVAKTTLEKTAEGLKTDMTAVKSYVEDDSKRREQLEQYTRTETARSTEALRKQVSENYVAKSQYSEDVRGITRKFEELRVGGTNLFKGSRNFEKELWDYNPYKNVPISERVDDMAVISADYLWGGLSQLIEVRAGETYTFSFWALSNQDNDQVNIYVSLNDWITKPKATVDAGSKTIVINKAWSRISFTFKVLSDGFIAPRLERFDANGILKYRGFKLERGAISSDWSPAPKDGEKYAETKLAEYKQTVDGRFATITNQLNNKANQTDFQKVQETTKLYERIIGSSESDVASKVSKMVMSNSLFQVEVSKNEGLKTVQTQLAGSWAVKNINSAGDLISGLNLGANGINRLDGRLTHITGQTLIDNAVIKSAMIDKLKTANFESGSVTTQILASGAVTADKLVVDQAFFNKISANYAYLRQLFSKDAFITSVQSVTMSTSKIVGGTLAAINGNMHIDLNNGQIHYYTDQAAMKRFLSGYPTQFIKFATGNVEGGTTAGVTVIGSNRYGTESSDDGGFVGIRAWNGNGNDSVDVVGDTVRLASSAYENADGWVVSTTGKLQIRPRREQDRRESTINVGDVWLFLDNSGYYTSLHNVLRRLSNSIGALYDYRAQNGEGTPAWWDTRSSVGRL